MSGRDVPIDEMRISLVSERDVERLFAGRVPAGGPELDDLTTFFLRLGDAYPRPSVAPYEEAHLAAMRRATQAVTGENGAVVQRLTAAQKPLRRRFIARGLLTMRTRIAAGGFAVVVAFGGLAGAGILPTPVQQAVAQAAAKLRIRLPGAPEARPESGDKDVNDPADHDGAQHPDGWMSGWTGWTSHGTRSAEGNGGGDQPGGGPGAGDDRSDKESESERDSDDEDDSDDFDEDSDDEDDSDDGDSGDEDDLDDDDLDDFDDEDDSGHEQGSEDDEGSDEMDDDATDASERESELDTETEDSD